MLFKYLIVFIRASMISVLMRKFPLGKIGYSYSLLEFFVLFVLLGIISNIISNIFYKKGSKPSVIAMVYLCSDLVGIFVIFLIFWLLTVAGVLPI